jgi:hypothetical protein
VVRQTVEPDESIWLQVCYGTSQNTNKLHGAEILVAGSIASTCGLGKETKFDVAQARPLPFDDEWFVIPVAYKGSSPRIGALTEALHQKLIALVKQHKPIHNLAKAPLTVQIKQGSPYPHPRQPNSGCDADS